MSQLWWQPVQLPDKALTPNYAISTQPIWQLMSGSTFPASAGVVSFLISTSFASEGGVPFFTTFEFETESPPTNGGVIRVFSGSIVTDLTPDVNGFTSYSMVCVDLGNAFFSPTYPFGFNLSGSNYAITAATFSNPAFNVVYQIGPIVVGGIPTASLEAGILSASFDFNYIDSSSYTGMRAGLAINAFTGSPQISLQPVTTNPTNIFPGDIWFVSSSIDGNSHLYAGDYSPYTASISSRIVTIRLNETTQSVINRFTSSDAPSSGTLAVNTIVADNWFITANSPTYSGSGIRNDTWGGGFYMPDSGTVAIYGTKNFLVPSGTTIISRSLFIQSGGLLVNNGTVVINSGTISISTGSLLVNSPSGTFIVSGSSAQLLLTGSNADARLRGVPITAVMINSINSGSISPIPRDGTIYINSGTIPEQISIRINGTWLNFSVVTPTFIDNGTY